MKRSQRDVTTNASGRAYISAAALDEPTVLKVAQSAGLDSDRLKRDMAAPEIDRALKANAALAEALDIRGTPAFVVGDDIVPGAIDLGTLKALIAAARQK